MKKIILLAVLAIAFIGCQDEVIDNQLVKTKWSYYYTTGGYLSMPLKEHYSYLEFTSNTEVRTYKGSANGTIEGVPIIGTYEVKDNNVSFKFPSDPLRAVWTGGKISNDILIVTYDYGGTTTYIKK